MASGHCDRFETSLRALARWRASLPRINRYSDFREETGRVFSRDARIFQIFRRIIVVVAAVNTTGAVLQ